MKELLHDDDIRDEGRAVGLSEGKAEDLLLVLGRKGEVSEALRRNILAEKDLTLLNNCFLQALSCESVDTFAAAMGVKL